MAGRLTTHVLDIGLGRPASGIPMILYRIDQNGLDVEVTRSITNEDGRVEEPLLQGTDLIPGVYELVFEVKSYLYLQHSREVQETLWDVIPIRFAIHDAGEHYHIPLLIAPGGYSTYRGS